LFEEEQHMQIKMIVTDLDGTLLRDDKTVSERSFSALAKCRERGIRIVYATGRGSSAAVIVPSEYFDGYVWMNGATAKAGNVLVYQKLLQIEQVRGLLLAADRAGLRIVAERDDWHYGNFNVTEEWPFLKQSKIVDFNELDIEVEKVYAIVNTPEDVKVIERHLPDDTYAYFSRDGFAMVMHKEAVKSKAVVALADHWGVKREEVVAFGDDINDIELLEFFGIGVAMGNALDETKTVADQICDTNDNDGMAKWLEENVLLC